MQNQLAAAAFSRCSQKFALSYCYNMKPNWICQEMFNFSISLHLNTFSLLRPHFSLRKGNQTAVRSSVVLFCELLHTKWLSSIRQISDLTSGFVGRVKRTSLANVARTHSVLKGCDSTLSQATTAYDSGFCLLRNLEVFQQRQEAQGPLCFE